MTKQRTMEFLGSPWGYMLFIAAIVAGAGLVTQIPPPAFVVQGGGFQLNISAADSERKTSAHYRMQKDGKDVWADDRSYSLREVTVTNQGWVIGYAYRTGEPLPPESRAGFPNYDACEPPEYLHVVILDASGKEVLNEINERVDPYYNIRCFGRVDAQPQPSVEHFVVDPANDRLIVHVEPARYRGPAWWFYRISTGAIQDRINPKPGDEKERRFRAMDVKAIPGTPYLLIHWLAKSIQVKKLPEVARFTVTHSGLTPLWELEWENNYAGLDIDGPLDWNDPRDFFKSNPAISLDPEPGHFSIRDFASHEFVHYSISKSDECCDAVSELSRQPFGEARSDL